MNEQDIIEKNKSYSFEKAINFIKNNKTRKFKETIETSIHLNVTPKKKNISIKGYSILPNDIEKNYNIGVFVTKDETITYNDTNITILNEDNIKEFNKKNLYFDIMITNPKSMIKIGKFSKLLNSKKIMPDIKYGTITNDISDTITKCKKNYIKFKNDKNDIINCIIGKIDLESKKLKENIETLINDIKKQKPKNCKNISIKKISISSTMGPGIKINVNSLII